MACICAAGVPASESWGNGVLRADRGRTALELVFDPTGRTLHAHGDTVLGAPDTRLAGISTDVPLAPSPDGRGFGTRRIRASSGLEWQMQATRVGDQVWEFRHRIRNTAATAVPLEGLGISFQKAGTNYGQITKTYVCQMTTNMKPETLDLGAWVGYFILHDAKSNRELHFFFPDWLDMVGAVSVGRPDQVLSANVWFDSANDVTDPAVRRLAAPFAGRPGDGGTAWQPRKIMLAPGEEKVVRYRVGCFQAESPMVPKAKAPFEILGDYYYRIPRGPLAAMGYPLPVNPTPYPGHIMALRWEGANDDKMLEWMARAGTGIVILQMADFRDISHGLSWEGDYDRVPPNMGTVIDKIHRLGMKAVCWFSIRGVFKDPAGDPKRNAGKPDALLARHPEWFLPNAVYWHNLYGYADMFSEGWKQWVLTKLASDLKRMPSLDGFAFDEPYFFGLQVGRSGDKVVTFARNGRDFLRDIHRTIKGFGQDKLVVANFWFPAADAFDFLDYAVQEGPGISEYTPLTRGKSCGARGIGEFFSWPFVYSHFGQLYVQHPVGIGWVHPEWYFVCRPHDKDPGAIADLLRFLGHAKLLAGRRIDADVSQLELELDRRRYLFLVNSSDKPRTIRATLYRPLPADCRQGRVTVDDDRTTEHRTIAAPAGRTVEIGVVKPRSILRVEWSAAEGRKERTP